MKVLWLSNSELVNYPTKSTGTWLQAMSKALVAQGIELYNITTSLNVKHVVRKDSMQIKQWLFPNTRLKNGLPPSNIIAQISALVGDISPDLIHIWGIERFWGMLSARGYLNYPTILEIQGLRYTCAEAYYGGMSFKDIRASIYFQDIIFPWRRIDVQCRAHRKWGIYEKEMLREHKFISTQSEWVRQSIHPYCSEDARIIHAQMAVRGEFLASSGWCKVQDNRNIRLLTIASSAVPYKGVHVLIKALALIIKDFPNIELRIVGDYQQSRKSFYKLGYVKYLEKLISKLHLRDHIVFTGPLNAEQLIYEMQQTDVMIHPSFVESYSLSLAEAMAVGVPSVVAYAGAMPELVNYGECALLYSPTDYYACAGSVCQLLQNPRLARDFSVRSRRVALERNDINKVCDNQIMIYNQILDIAKSKI